MRTNGGEQVLRDGLRDAEQRVRDPRANAAARALARRLLEVRA